MRAASSNGTQPNYEPGDLVSANMFIPLYELPRPLPPVPAWPKHKPFVTYMGGAATIRLQKKTVLDPGELALVVSCICVDGDWWLGVLPLEGGVVGWIFSFACLVPILSSGAADGGASQRVAASKEGSERR